MPGRHRVAIGDASIAQPLYDFVNHEAMPGTGIDPAAFWPGLLALCQDLAPENAQLLQRRDALQRQIDQWHGAHPGADFDAAEYRRFLEQIGYLEASAPAFEVDTEHVDVELASTAGPQLVVPLDNARFALNAANARWGSLLDALYGTDAIAAEGGGARGGRYNPVRGERVIRQVRERLDAWFPLTRGSHTEAIGYRLVDGALEIALSSGEAARLREPCALRGFNGAAVEPSALLLRQNGLHVELSIDRDHALGRNDPAGLADVLLESALTTIQDCEDSVAAVDVDDKLRIYRNWLGLMQGSLSASFAKDGQLRTRRLNADRRYRRPDGGELVLPGRSLLLVRHVGNLLMSDMITLDSQPVPENFIDAAVTVLIALHDLKGQGELRNSRCGSVYIVKPKMHGSAEVAFADRLFTRVERLLGLAPLTLKMGIMDEERRTSLNLRSCIEAARSRVVFINTGFLDRTGDEIHTSMEAGPVRRKAELKQAPWFDAYERRNVAVGLECGLPGRGQIGKGMWAMPDLMAAMLATKVEQMRAGASTAWVPSPTAATLHAIHYHDVDVAAVQAQLRSQAPAGLEALLTPPLAAARDWTPQEIEQEIDNNVQGILGYVVRWIDFGIGCSKVLDYHNVALMEDRATLRISSQHVANWLRHGVCTREQVEAALARMAQVVDAQNASDAAYRPMSTDLDGSIAFQSARELIFRGCEQPNGYTEPILFAQRLKRKALDPR